MVIDSVSEACCFLETNAGILCTFAGHVPQIWVKSFEWIVYKIYLQV